MGGGVGKWVDMLSSKCSEMLMVELRFKNVGIDYKIILTLWNVWNFYTVGEGG